MSQLFARMREQEPESNAGGREESPTSLQWICRSVLRASFPLFRDAEIDASFYPYIGLTHTIRRKGSGWVLRISDHCRNAPRPVLEAIVMILGSKIVHKSPPRKFLRIYELYRKDPYVQESVRRQRQRKGRKRMAGCEGRHHSLAEMFQSVNSRFFNNQIEVRKIGWGLRKGWRRLGHYDPVHQTITLSPALDSPGIPDYVVRYIVYHEMLHVIFEETPSGGFRKHHPPAFHRAEREYPDYDRARKFLREHFGQRRRRIED